MSVNDQGRMVPAKLPFWLKQMAQEIGSREKPVKSVGEVLAVLFGDQIRKRHASLPKLGQAAEVAVGGE
ncbi:hypothetical protein GobsT_36930 [Gemmata obscuriglobus]|nr:hypothetical protein [Gemmata obscuriglobus]QEG28905.1 hypothetical protein GobsT_36930 [Gemmata obscuriglobus]VTS07381.1 unnamed protein product [Gemmata obscuriglobus UQM 2246]